MIPIRKLTSIKILLGLLITSGIMTYGFKTHVAKAAVGVSGLTGKYSCMGNRNFSPMMASLQNSSTVAANFLTIIDFDSHTATGIIFTNSAWNQGGVMASNQIGSGTFTEAVGPISGSFQFTFTSVVNGINNIGKSNFLLSNSGNTLFYSVDSSTNNTPETGVCQKQ